MKLIPLIRNVSLGASAGVALLTALPVFGAAGTITAAGAVVGSLVGGMAGWLDTQREQQARRQSNAG
jgi:membrane associated rhomboid family serine protease